VRTVSELSSTSSVTAPLPVLSVPVAGRRKLFVTHTESPALEIGSGEPNGQPVSVQSTPAGVEPERVWLTVHAGPTQESAKRFVAPAGVTLSGTCEMPPPSDRFAQTRFFSTTVVPARSRNVWPQFPLPAVVVKSNFVGPAPIVDVVVLDVEVVVELDDEVLELDDDELLDVDVLEVELVEVDVLEELEVEVDVVLDVDVLLVDVEDVLVLVVDEVLVEDVELDDVLDVEDVDVEVELVDVEVVELVELELVDVLDVEVELVDDVLVVDVVVVAFGLHCVGSGFTNSGTATASMQSVLKVDTQSTQSTTSCVSTIAPVQLDGSKVVTAGHVPEKPYEPGVRSAAPPQSLSVPPHALQMLEIFFVSALEMRSIVLPAGSPGFGQLLVWTLFRRRSQHF
jgi:hypothetical protein